MIRLFLGCLLAGALFANPEILPEGPVHEGFVSQEFGTIPLEAVAYKPPMQLVEQVPSPLNENFIWIPGYWEWSKKYDDFVWVSGVWRQPPPQHVWIEGSWKHRAGGWVRIQGFWSPIPEGELTLVEQPPPDRIDEPMKEPVKSAGDLFWVSGCWHFVEGEYQWYSGRWEVLDPNWVYVPANYYWRHNGYILIPGYWDWPLEHRGVAYYAVWVFSQPEQAKALVYEPADPLHPLQVMELLYPNWPNYASIFRHHLHFHYDDWARWGGMPPWWKWQSWWTFTPNDMWALWWWWSHQGYPSPEWMDREIADKIYPPRPFVLSLMRDAAPPPIVTPHGVVTVIELLDALKKVEGSSDPIMPPTAKKIEKVQRAAAPRSAQKRSLRPRGEGVIPPQSKPQFGTKISELKRAPVRVPILPKPNVPIEDNLSAGLTFKDRMLSSLQVISAPNLPEHSAEEKSSLPPVQGSKPEYEYPQTPMQQQHLDDIITKPQPQRNPQAPGPNF